MDKVASGTIGTEANTVVGATKVRLILGMTGHCSELLVAVSKLTFVSVFASAVLLKGSTHLGFVTVGVLDNIVWARGHWGALGLG